MRETLEVLGQGYEWYKIRREEFKIQQSIPFRVSPKPLYLSPDRVRQITAIGPEVVNFLDGVDELFRTDETVKTLLNRGKPDFFSGAEKPRYLFIRPDLIITQDGFTVCELETSPFGLALADLLNKSYRKEGQDTLVEDGQLSGYIQSVTPSAGKIIYSSKTVSYAGQMRYLADNIFSSEGSGRDWGVINADQYVRRGGQSVYRAFYQHEALADGFVRTVVESVAQDEAVETFPSFTPYLEEKAVMALLWDRRWESFFQRQLGKASFDQLRNVIPPTWIVGQEDNFSLRMPVGTTSLDIATLSKAKRGFVLKASGFSGHSSWSEGVSLLHEKSGLKVRELVSAAIADQNALYIIQEFRRGQKVPMVYEDEMQGLVPMEARVRLTPYFGMVGVDRGRLIAIKATGCENTDYIHASTASINTAVAMQAA